METNTQTFGLEVITFLREHLIENAELYQLQTPDKITRVVIKYIPNWSGLKLTYSWITNDPDSYFCIKFLHDAYLYEFYTHFKSFLNGKLTGFEEFLASIGKIMVALNKLMRDRYGEYLFTVDFNMKAHKGVPLIRVTD